VNGINVNSGNFGLRINNMKIIKIETCNDCKYCEWSIYNQDVRCSLSRKKLPKKDIIPVWCKLEDYKDK
jgi:hypothetical protein